MANDKSQLNLPRNTTLPFFAYGIFKPGQISYSRIEPYVKKPPIKDIIPHELYLRDGVPFISQEITKRPSTWGYFIEFNNDEDAKEAYDIIGEIESKKLYFWKEITVSGKKTNVLFGKKPSRSRPQRIGPSFNGRIDPYFNEAIEVIEEEIKDKKSIVDIVDYFKILRNYILLWSAIERYTSLRYGNGSKTNNNERLANEKVFQEALECVLGDNTRKIFRTDTLGKHCLNAEDPEDSIKYYYTIRCNIVHRGKMIDEKDEMVLKSLKELVKIFKFVLEDTFK